MKNNRVARESNIELLRVLSMMGVIVLHYNNPIFGGGLMYAVPGSVNFYILYILETLFACAVNLFVLISGYFMCKSNKRNLIKPIQLIIQVMAFSLVIYLLRCVLGRTIFSFKSLALSLIPANWFVILYIALYIISPFINVALSMLSKSNFKKLLLIIFILFSIYPTLVDLAGELRSEQWYVLSSVGMYGSQWGYSIINFMLVYIIGAYIRINDIKVKKSNLWLILIMCIVLITGWSRLNDVIGYFNEKTAWSYCNPLIITEAIVLFLIFKNIKTKPSLIINSLAKASFTVFLLHNSFLGKLNVQKFAAANPLLMILHLLISCIGIYLICWLVHLLYDKITNPVFELLKKSIGYINIGIAD